MFNEASSASDYTYENPLALLREQNDKRKEN